MIFIFKKNLRICISIKLTTAPHYMNSNGVIICSMIEKNFEYFSGIVPCYPSQILLV
jgi:hypothetical protein